MNFGLNSLPFWVSFLPPCFYFLLFMLYFLEGRFGSYIPTISETGTQEPNMNIMPIFFVGVSASIFYAGIGLGAYISSRYRLDSFKNKLLMLVVLVTCFGFIALSIFPCDTSSDMHYLFASIGLTSCLSSQVLAHLYVYKYYRWNMNLFRTIVIIFQAVGLYCVRGKLDLRQGVTQSALGEYAFLAGLPFFYLSFWKELDDIGQCLVFLK
jgi:hypothetical protein